MKQERGYPIAVITSKGERALKSGHPWVYGAEIKQLAGGAENGGLVDVVSAGGSYLGTGFYNDQSKIAIRVFSRNANDRFDEAFWLRRLEYAVAYRKTVMPGGDFKCCRLIHGEADQFPGLTIDRYDNLLVAQVLSLGMERIKPVIFNGLYRILTGQGERIDGLFERTRLKCRTSLALPTLTGWSRICITTTKH